MKNLDAIQEERERIMAKFSAAIASEDGEVFAQAYMELAESIEKQVKQEVKELNGVADANILASRGVRQLTSGEKQYYEALIDAMRSDVPQQALSNLDVVMPRTIIDATFEDLQQAHPLLDAIDFENTSGMIEWYMNTNTKQLATWGTLTDEITKELSSGFKKINLMMNKLSAWIPIAKSMLDLGPAWLDRYVRIILQESIYYGLEEGIINGTGKNEPIGMKRQVGEDVTVTAGVYPEKTPVEVTSLDPVSYGQLLSGMAVAPNGNYRVVKEVIMVVNPVDYLQKVMPATTVMRPDGTYANDVLPFPTRIIPSAQMAQGKAIFGLSKRYFMGIGTAKSGKIEYADQYKFLEDERTYLTKLYGHGQPKDNTAFVYADISGLKPAAYRVVVEDTTNP